MLSLETTFHTADGKRTEQRVIEGAGGKGGDTPTEAADSLFSNTIGSAVDLLSEGEIEGLVGTYEGVYYNETPYEIDGQANFEGATIVFNYGRPDQAALPGFADVRTSIPAANGDPLPYKADPLGGTVMSFANDGLHTAVDVTLATNNFFKVQDDGDTVGTHVTFAIEISENSGAFREVIAGRISGKQKDDYAVSYRVPITNTDGITALRIRRTKPESTSLKENDNLYLKHITTITEHMLAYPNCAVVGHEFDAKQFGNKVPTRQYHLKGIKVQVPSNYDAATRTYNGPWDGSLKATRVYTNNPVWVFYDLISSTRYGLGQFIDPGFIDLPSLYQVAKWCDEFIYAGTGERSATATASGSTYTVTTSSPHGFRTGTYVRVLVNGVERVDVPITVTSPTAFTYTDPALNSVTGTVTIKEIEPRWTCNTVIMKRGEAFDVLREMVSCFRGILFWMDSKLWAMADMPQTGVKIVTNSNVIDGTFTYSGESNRRRYSVIKVAWNDPAVMYRRGTEVYEDPDLIREIGWKPTDYGAFGCTSRGQARRLAKAILYEQEYGSEIVTYRASFDHLAVDGDTGPSGVAPGDIVYVADNERGNAIQGGRTLGVNGSVITLDRDTGGAGTGASLYVEHADGTVETVACDYNGSTATLTGTPVGTMGVNDLYILIENGADAEPFRVVKISEVEPNIYEIAAVRWDDGKFNTVYGEEEYDFDDIMTPPKPDSVTAPVGPIAYTEGFIYNADLRSRTLELSWGASPDKFLHYYQVSYSKDDDNWIDLPPTSAPGFKMENVRAGKYEFRVVAVNRLGRYSAALSGSYTMTAVPDSTSLPVGSILNLGIDKGGTTFGGKDAKLEWDVSTPTATYLASQNVADVTRGIADPAFRDCIVRVYSLGGTLLREESVVDTAYVYTHEKNAEDNGGSPVRSVRIDVLYRDIYSRTSTPASITISNPVPAFPVAPAVVPATGAIAIDVTAPADLDFAGIKVYADLTANGVSQTAADLRYVGPNTQVILQKLADAEHSVIVVPFDVFGDGTASAVLAVTPLSGESAVTGYLTNESHTVATASDGSGGAYGDAGGTFYVLDGTSQISTGITFANPTANAWISLNTTTGAYTVSDPGVDNASATLTAEYRGVVITKTYTIAKSRAGAPGSDGSPGAAAKTLSIVSDRQTIAYDTDGVPVPATQTTTFTADKQNTTATVNWTVTDAAGVAKTPTTSFLSAASGNSVTMTLAQFAAARGTTSGVIVTATLTDGTTLTDRISVTKVQDGAIGPQGPQGQPGLDGNDGINGTDGKLVQFVWIRAATAPAAPTGNGIPTGWSDNPPAGTDPLWMSEAKQELNGTLVAGETWSAPIRHDGPKGEPGNNGVDGIDGTDGKLVQFVWQRAATAPAAPTGNNIPTGWSDEPPAGTEPLWMSKSKQELDGTLVTGAIWSTPIRHDGPKGDTGDQGAQGIPGVDGNDGINGTDGKLIQFIWQRAANQPAIPTGNGIPTGWFDNPPAGTDPLWMAEAKQELNGVLVSGETWSSPIRHDGPKGDPGTSGIDGIDGADGKLVQFVWKRAATAPVAPTGNNIPTGWSDEPPAGTDPLWMSKAKQELTGVLVAGGSWSAPIRHDGPKGDKGDTGEQGIPGTNGNDGIDGTDGKLIQFVWRRAATLPTAPTGNGIPVGWYDNPPAGTDPLWMSEAKQELNGVLVSGESWSAPIRHDGPKGEPGTSGIDGIDGEDGKLVQFVWRRAATVPATPTGSNIPTGWSDEPPAGTDPLWMSKAKQELTGALVSGGTWSVPIRHDGPKGADGTDGAPGTDGQNGVDALVGYLTNESHTLSANPDGTIPAGGYTGANGQFVVFWGILDITSQCTFSVATAADNPQSLTGPHTSNTVDAGGTIQSTGTGAGSYSVTGGFDAGETNATVTFTATHATAGTVTRKLSLAKSLAGSNGDPGAAGANTGVIRLFQRKAFGAAAPVAPSVACTYTFATGGLTGHNNGWAVEPPEGFGILWSIAATAHGTGPTDTIATNEWSTPSIFFKDAMNTATVFLYQRKSGTAPAKPSTNSTYTFSTKTLTGFNNGWSTSVPGGTNPLYVITATASSVLDFDTDTIVSTEWSTPTVMAQDGAAGADAKLIKLTATHQTFPYDTLGNAKAQTVTFTVEKKNTSAAVTWRVYKIHDTATAILSGDTAVMDTTSTFDRVAGQESLTQTHTQFASLLSGNAMTGYIIEALVSDGGVTYSDRISVQKIQDGAKGDPGVNSLIGYLTNETHTVPSTTDGIVSTYTGASGEFKVFSGLDDVSSSFTLSTPTGGNPQALTVDYTGRSYAVSAGFDGNEGAATLTIRATGSGAFAGKVIDRVFTLAKTYAGINGKTFTLISNSQTVKYNTNDALIAGQSVTFEGYRQHTTANLLVRLYRKNLDGTTTQLDAGSYLVGSGTITVDNPDVNSFTQDGTTISLSGGNFHTATSNGTALGLVVEVTCDGLTDKVSVIKVSDGAKGAAGDTGPTLSVTADKAGFTYAAGALSPTSQTVTYTAKLDGVATAANWSTVPNIKSATGVSTFAVSAADMGTNAEVTITATIGGVSQSMTLTKLVHEETVPPTIEGTTRPTNPVRGTIWVDTSDANRHTYQWNGTSWVYLSSDPTNPDTVLIEDGSLGGVIYQRGQAIRVQAQ